MNVVRLTGPLPEIIEAINTTRENRQLNGAAYMLTREHQGYGFHEASCWVCSETFVNEWAMFMYVTFYTHPPPLGEPMTSLIHQAGPAWNHGT